MREHLVNLTAEQEAFYRAPARDVTIRSSRLAQLRL
jgi:hypothetical protein